MALAAAPDLERLVRREHSTPHDVLGAHPADGGVVIRAFRPAAAAVRPCPPAGDPIELELVHPGGVFEGVVEGAELPLAYRARGRLRRVRARSRSTTRTASCRRSASSTCTSSARAATRSCGRSSARTCARSTASAAPRSRSGRRPPARSPSSATSTSGTAACTRCARSAPPACGSCSCPASSAGARYKYEILAPDGEIRLKADPLAFATEVPPKTASVVHELDVRVDRRGVARRARASAGRSRARCRSTRSTSARGG